MFSYWFINYNKCIPQMQNVNNRGNCAGNSVPSAQLFCKIKKAKSILKIYIYILRRRSSWFRIHFFSLSELPEDVSPSSPQLACPKSAPPPHSPGQSLSSLFSFLHLVNFCLLFQIILPLQP